MARHDTHSMHEHSIKAYHEMKGSLSAREFAIYDVLWQRGQLTDREIMDALGKHDPNYVRPRVTEMIGRGVLSEIGSKQCNETGRQVRLVSIPVPPGDDKRQGVLF